MEAVAAFYALAFYAAKTGDVTMYAMHNEPNIAMPDQ